MSSCRHIFFSLSCKMFMLEENKRECVKFLINNNFVLLLKKKKYRQITQFSPVFLVFLRNYESNFNLTGVL